MAPAIRSESESDSLIALPSSCISSFNLSSKTSPFSGHLQVITCFGAFNPEHSSPGVTSTSLKVLVQEACNTVLIIRCIRSRIYSVHRRSARYYAQSEDISRARRNQRLLSSESFCSYGLVE